MRIAVLSSGDGWHVRDLARAAGVCGHELVTLSFRRIQAGVAARPIARTMPFLRDAASAPVDLDSVDRVIVRTMPSGSLEQVIFRMNALGRLMRAGVPVCNPPRALEAAVDKYLASWQIELSGVAVPPTVVCENADDALGFFQQLGGDVVVKPIFGSEGKGITRVRDADVAYRVFKTLERLGAVLYLQKFIEHDGSDVRAFVLGGRVLAAMRRRHPNDWRTNVARGACAEPYELSGAEADVAIRAAGAVGAVVAGVDLLHARDGTNYVLEVNAVPGWRALARATNVDVATELLRFIERWEG